MTEEAIYYINKRYAQSYRIKKEGVAISQSCHQIENTHVRAYYRLVFIGTRICSHEPRRNGIFANPSRW
jgi:hypothetical protein